MKKKMNFKRLVILTITVSMMLSAFTMTANAATGDNCTTPIVVNLPSQLPYTTTDTTNGRVNDYYSTGMGYYDEGPDIIYQLNVASTTNIQVTVTPVGTYQYAGVGLFNSCPDVGTLLIMSTASNGPVGFTYSCSPGTYYLMIDNWPSPSYIDFTLTIVAGAGPQPGDTCALAIGAVAGLNSAAKQPIWYHYTPTQNCQLKITSNLVGQYVDTYLHVYNACAGTEIAYKDDDMSGNYNYASTVQFAASAGIDYKIWWEDYWETSAFNFQITEITGCDVGVTKIIHPVSGDGPGAITPQVNVHDFMGGGATCDAHINIYSGPMYSEKINEKFEGSWPPSGWNVINNGGDCVWMRNDMYGRYNYFGGYCADADIDICGYGTTMNTELISPRFSLAGTTTPVLQFSQYFYSYSSYNQYGDVDISIDDGATWITLAHYTGASIYNSAQTIPLTAYAGQSQCLLRFHYFSTQWAYYWEIDNVLLYQPGSSTPIYTGTVTGVNVPAGGNTAVSFSPSWTPPSSGSYSAKAWTTTACDTTTTNDQTSIALMYIGNVDAMVSSIIIPGPYMGNTTFTPTVTVKNNGDVNALPIPVHVAIDDPGTVNPVLNEDFTDMCVALTDDPTTKIEFGKIIPGGGTSENIVPDMGTVKVFQAGDPAAFEQNCWVVIDYNMDGTTWHQSTATYTSGPYSMYTGKDSTLQTPAGSYELLISPRIHVGTTGGKFNFNWYLNMDSYDYVYFGNSATGYPISVYSIPYYYSGGWYTWTSPGVSIITTSTSYVDTNGNTRFFFYFRDSPTYPSADMGIFIDDFVVNANPIYTQDMTVTLNAGATQTLVFPAFTPPIAKTGYQFSACTEQCYDELLTNDCMGLTFATNAPVYILETGMGFTTISPALLAVQPGQTIIVTDGNYYEDLIINTPDITVMGVNKPTCDTGYTYLFGTVDIVADGVTFENFYVKPLTLFTADEAGIAIYSNDAIVCNNTVEIMGETSGTIKGIHAYASPSDFKQNILIADNCVHDVYNTLGCTSGGGGGGTILSEDFEGSWLTTGWSVVDNLGSCIWERNDWYGRTNYLNGAYCAIADEDWCWSPMDTELRTPIFSLAGMTATTLNFENYWYSYTSYDQYGDVDISTDGGSTWTNLVQYWGSSVSGHVSIPLTAYEGQTNCQIRFHFYVTQWAYYWEVDDVLITGTPSGGGGGSYGGADGIMVQGATWNVDVLRNTVYDIISPGWSSGIEVTPTAEDPYVEHFQNNLYFAEDFTGQTSGAIPTGWTRSVTNWGADTSMSIGLGAVAPCMRFLYASTGSYWIRTPTIDTTGFTTLTASFIDSLNHYSGTNYYQIHFRTFANGVEHDIQTWTPSASTGAAQHTYTLTAADGVGASDFQLEWLADGNTFYMNYWYFDNVVLSGSYSYDATVNPWPLDVNIMGNIIRRISVGPAYTCDSPPVYRGIMLNINYANLPSYGPTPADASQVIAHHNWFDMDCYTNATAILNTDLQHCLDATDNYYSQPDGPGSYDPMGGNAMAIDCMTGEVADGLGTPIWVYGPVHFDPWLGLNAETNIVSPYNVEVGETIAFDGSASWQNDFNGVDVPFAFYWNFDDGFYSMQPAIAHTYNSPGTYNGYLRVHMLGVPELGIPPLYEWSYFTIVVGGAGSPLAANAGGGSLGIYTVSIGSPITLSGIASGGTAPYTYQWSLGDGRTVDGRTPIVEYKAAGTYTVTLTVTDANYDTASDTATVTVLAPDQLNVIINAPANANKGLPLKFTSTVTGGEAPYAYEWNFGDQTPINIAANPVHIFENAGVYTVTVTVTDNVGTVKTATKIVTIESEQGSSAEIKEVKGGFRVTATIAAGSNDCPWTIHVDGNFVLSGGDASGTIDVNTQETVKLPLTFAFGNVDIIVTAGTIQKQYTAFALGPLFLNVHEA